MTAWQRWHDDYSDASSALAQRLAVVQERIRGWADEARPGPLRLVSMCAGQGHDVVGALAGHPRRAEVSGLLVELDRANVGAAQRRLREVRLQGVSAVVGDAARLDAYRTAVPADLVLVCGVFGNISPGDVRRTIAALPVLTAAGATVVWTRHRRAPDLTVDIRGWFEEAGFVEVDFTSPGADSYAVGTHRFIGELRSMTGDEPPLFTFLR